MRQGVYYHRAAIPADIRDTYPKTEETFSLKTKNPREAVLLVRKAAVEVDERFEAHRRMLRSGSVQQRDELADAEVIAVEEAYYTHLLDEDDEKRLLGFYDGEQLPLPTYTFEEYEEAVQSGLGGAKYMLARAKSDVFYDQEVDEVLSWDPFSLRLSKGAQDRKRVVMAIQRAEIRAYKAIEGRNQGEIIDTPKPGPILVVAGGPLLSVASTDWIREKRLDWEAKTSAAHSTAMRWFLELAGDRALGSYTKADGRAFKKALQFLPSNWSKHPKLIGMDFGAASVRAEALELPPMSAKNAVKNVRFLSAFWRWAVDNFDEVESDPMVLPAKSKIAARDERDSFTSEDLKVIFGSTLYTGCVSVSKWKQSGGLKPTDSGRYWVPLVALYTGARMAEIVQLHLEDIKFDSGIAYMSVEVGEEESDDRRLKTANSRRNIPVHSRLIELGFLRFVDAAGKNGKKRLFPDIKKGADGTYSSVFSKWFSRYLTEIGVKTRKKSFHSFRHTFEDACKAAGVPLEYINALQGHAQGGEADRYGGAGYPVGLLKGYIEAVNHPLVI